MRYIAVPLHDRQRIVREGPGKYVDIREHGTERTRNDCGPCRRRAQRAEVAALGKSSGNITAREKRFSGQCPHNSVCDRVHEAGFFASS
jgi:hypothetical protein